MEMSTVRQEDREQFWENMCVRTSGDSVIFQRRKSCSIFNAVRWTHWRLQTHTQCVVIHNLWRVMKISRTFAAQNLRIRHFKWAQRLCDLKRQTLSWRDRRKGKGALRHTDFADCNGGALHIITNAILICLLGLEELVLSEINSPSRTQQTGDSSSVSSFSYRDIIKEAQPTIQNKVSIKGLWWQPLFEIRL